MNKEQIMELARAVLIKMQREDAEFAGRFEDIVLILSIVNELGSLKPLDWL